MAEVPSNLIPTRITQLPLAPVADENSLMMIVYQGNNYQIRVGDLLSVAGVPTTRQVIAGTGMSGGGQLSSNVTLSIAPGGVGTTQLANSGVTPAVYGSATEIPVITVDATGRVMAATTLPVSVSGFVPESRQVVAGAGLTGGGPLNANVTLAANLSDAAPLVLDGAGAAGVSTAISRADHQHPAVDLSDADQINGILPLDQGGTARSLVPNAGAIIWCGADGLYVGPAGSAGQVLVSNGANEYTWGSAILVVDQPANVIYAGPAAGPDAPTTFRSMVNADLPNSGVAANTYGSATTIPVLTVNAKGVVTSASTVSFTGGLSFQGGWNASTNTPTLTSSTGVNGYYYIVSTAGSTNLNGITDWQIGDWAIFNGTVWQKIDQTDLVASVNGQVGVVVLGASDVGAQPADAQLTDIAGLTPADGAFIVGDGTNFIAETGSTARASMGAAASGANGDITSMTGVTGGISSPDFIQFDTTATVTDATGRLYYDDADMFQTLAFQMNGAVVQHVGEEMYYRVRLSSPATKGQVLMFTGTLGASGGLTAAPATGLTPSQSNYILGVSMQTGTTNDWVTVVEFGEIKQINTTGGAEAWAQGDVLYYNPAVAGGLTKTKPTAPNAIAIVAAVVHVGSSNGILFVRPTFGSVLGGTDGNVEFASITNGDVIVYDGTDQRWENRAQSTLTAGAVANAVTFNSSGGAAPNTSFNGSAARTVDYSTVGAPKADGTGASGTWGINISGNAATATVLQTARTIGGVSFDGSANINLPGVNTAGNQNTSGNAATATTATTATNATNVATTATSTNADFFVPFVAAATTGNQALGVDAGLTYNPSTNAMTTGINGGTF
jgi:hypothetical protein